MLEKLINEAKAKKKGEEGTYWKSRWEWIENFPFQKTYHPTLTFDPEALNYDRLPKAEVICFPRRDESIGKWKSCGVDTLRCGTFAKTRFRYSPEFEQIHYILTEGRGWNSPRLSGAKYTARCEAITMLQHRILNSNELGKAKLGGIAEMICTKVFWQFYSLKIDIKRLDKNGLLNGEIWKIEPKRKPCGIIW